MLNYKLLRLMNLFDIKLQAKTRKQKCLLQYTLSAITRKRKMKKRPTIHVPHGYIAFGKSTLARKLAESLPAVLINFDEWGKKLYGPDLDMEKIKIMNPLLYGMAGQIISMGMDIVFDGGYWSKSARKDLADFAKSINAQLIFYEITLDMETARTRMKKRNDENNPLLFVGEEFFDDNISKYSKISDDENLQVEKV